MSKSDGINYVQVHAIKVGLSAFRNGVDFTAWLFGGHPASAGNHPSFVSDS